MSSHSSVLGSGGALEIGEAGLAGAATGVRPPSPPRDRMQAQRFQDALFHQVTRFFAFSVLAILVAILGALLYGAWPALKEFGAGFPFSADWNPVTDKFGGLISVYGTLSTSFIALFVAIPVSFGIALFLTELCPPSLRGPLGIAVELLAAVPSIIYGMWGFVCFCTAFCGLCSAAPVGHSGKYSFHWWPFSGAEERNRHPFCRLDFVRDGYSVHCVGHARRF